MSVGKVITAVVSLLLVSGFATSGAQQTQKSRIARGKYLVEQAAMCVDCHSPRNERGEFIRERWLQGAPLDFAPIHPIPDWADHAPSLVGLPPGWTEAETIKTLETGIAPTGKMLRPPMPQYRMSRADASAIVAYLKSLKRAGD